MASVTAIIIDTFAIIETWKLQTFVDIFGTVNATETGIVTITAVGESVIRTMSVILARVRITMINFRLTSTTSKSRKAHTFRRTLTFAIILAIILVFIAADFRLYEMNFAIFTRKSGHTFAIVGGTLRYFGTNSTIFTFVIRTGTKIFAIVSSKARITGTFVSIQRICTGPIDTDP